MSNTRRYFELMRDFRAATIEVDELLAGSYQVAEKYKGSQGYKEFVAKLDKQKREAYGELREEANRELDAIITDMEQAFNSRPMTPPTVEQTNLLQVLKMKGNRLTKDEVTTAARSLEGCDAALSVLSDLARESGLSGAVPGLVDHMTGSTVKRLIGRLETNGSIFINRIEGMEQDRKIPIDRNMSEMEFLDWYLSREAAVADEASTLQHFGGVADAAEFCTMVNGDSVA